MKQFSSATTWLNAIDSETAGKLITVAADIALVLSDAREGLIRDVSFGSDAMSASIADKWIGQPWADIVSADSRSKVEALLRDSTARGCRAGARSITSRAEARVCPSRTPPCR